MSSSYIEKGSWILLVMAFVLTTMNSWALSGMATGPVQTSLDSTPAVVSQTSQTNQAALLAVLPKGTPQIYGPELGVSFDAVSTKNPALADATIRKMAVLDNSITLSGENLERYIRITNQISCEYCCGVAAITDKSGNAACGCAHSYAMRGLAKYLITAHAAEFSDAQILEELGKWKTLFFPDNAAGKALALQANGIAVNYANISSNQYRGIEAGQTGQNMVGGC